MRWHAGAGEENIDLVESLRKSKSIQTITVRHEQAGGFMAATYGRLTGHRLRPKSLPTCKGQQWEPFWLGIRAAFRQQLCITQSLR